MRSASPQELEDVGEPSTSPANEGSSAAPISGTVGHGPLPLPGSFYQRLPVHCSLYVQTEHTHGTGTLWDVTLEGCRVTTAVLCNRAPKWD